MLRDAQGRAAGAPPSSHIKPGRRGLRRDEARTRADARVVEWDAKRGMVKLNPIAAWTQDDVDAYIADNGILVNPLLFDGYGSIGCAPCTRRIARGRGRRAPGAGPARRRSSVGYTADVPAARAGPDRLLVSPSTHLSRLSSCLSSAGSTW